ncbi:hypothetical protein [Nannocystis sp.]|uniref:hypothetical protein n=1 Tax=Nannocystis sp. TaxID=1962667 RepID=UPI0024282E69|nr:hypothetical protein [Nannocystis sp.]MBK7823935.1 hypothetical protein [Nannocystis sp.]MBK9754946.1 hypothetical protein [Nannocystis sp.]
MATWILILHLVFPLSSTLPTPVTPATEPAAEIVRYRGLEQMFARFEAEADSDIEIVE